MDKDAPTEERPVPSDEPPSGRPPEDPPRDTDDRDEAAEKKRGPLHFLRELPGLILIALVLALLIKTFLIQAFYIPSQSMEPTLMVGDRVIVNKVVYRFRDPRRGEIIVFENPAHVEPERNPLESFWHWIIEGLGFSTDPTKDFIKRVVAIPGDTIEIRAGDVFINGEQTDEPYISPVPDVGDFGPETIPEDRYFVMGDNRANSQDSRIFEAIKRDTIVGRAFLILWPPSRFGWLRAG